MIVPYSLARRALFTLDAEIAHELTINSLRCTPYAVAKATLNPGVMPKPVELMGLKFPNPVGLAAGLDKNGIAVDGFGGMGFGFVEVGTVTPKAQPGNPKPRLFRLPEHQAIINRMGFNNHGVDALVKAVSDRKFSGPLGINIGKNKSTPNENALDDYLYCLERVWPVADYITVNISSPNTPGLRELQNADELNGLLRALRARQLELADQHGNYRPLTVKIAPDQPVEGIEQIASALREHQIGGVIATNTTIERAAVAGHKHADEAGGLSGTPVAASSTAVIAELRQQLGADYPIIGVGGISTAAEALAKRAAGANLVQLYTGFIYRGPDLIREIVEQW